jgi:hypothetical protein
LLIRADVTYFHIRRVADAPETGAALTPDAVQVSFCQLLGDVAARLESSTYHPPPPPQAWRVLAADYEKDGLYYATCGFALATLAMDDIPELRRRLGKAQRTVVDMGKKKAEALASVASYRQKYAAQCRELGIDGANPADQLRGLVFHARDIYRDAMVAAQAEGVRQAMEYYVHFTAFTSAVWVL